jgi:hypothetical protein
MEIMLDYEFMRLEKEGKLAWLTFTRENHQYYFELQQRAQFGPDAKEAKIAYLDKRTPNWQ